MRRAGGLLLGMIALALGTPVVAGAWTQPKGRSQVIVKAEYMRAGRGFDPAGVLADLPAERRDAVAGVFAEYGLTDSLTVQFKGDWQSGEDAFVEFEGRGPVELGVTWQAWRSGGSAVSLYAGYAYGGEGRNAGYAQPGQGEEDWEVRVSAWAASGAIRTCSRPPDRAAICWAQARSRKNIPIHAWAAVCPTASVPWLRSSISGLSPRSATSRSRSSWFSANPS